MKKSAEADDENEEVATVLAQLPAFFQSSTTQLPPPTSYPHALYRSLLVGFTRLRCTMYGIRVDEDETEILGMSTGQQSCPSRVSAQVAGLALAELRFWFYHYFCRPTVPSFWSLNIKK